MTTAIAQLQKAIAPLQEAIIQHPVYSAINDLEDLHIFMSYHVYAVWDFMSLLKSLQQELTCVTVPWFPKGLADTRYLINEIVVGEESDVDMHGKRTSHFELYVEAMRQCGAETDALCKFISSLQAGSAMSVAYEQAETPQAARDFVDFTFSIINSGKAHLQSAVFTFGREDLIPGMFYALVNDLHRQFPDSIANFKYYLDRHIEVDGGHHSALALQMTRHLCGEDPSKWQEAQEATIVCLQKRMALWDGAYEQIMRHKHMVM